MLQLSLQHEFVLLKGFFLAVIPANALQSFLQNVFLLLKVFCSAAIPAKWISFVKKVFDLQSSLQNEFGLLKRILLCWNF